MRDPHSCMVEGLLHLASLPNVSAIVHRCHSSTVTQFLVCGVHRLQRHVIIIYSAQVDTRTFWSSLVGHLLLLLIPSSGIEYLVRGTEIIKRSKFMQVFALFIQKLTMTFCFHMVLRIPGLRKLLPLPLQYKHMHPIFTFSAQ